MILTPRDVDLLRAVHRHRFLRSSHLVGLAGGSRQAVLRRLQLLFHQGYLERPVIQLEWYTRGSRPLVYALGKRGAKALAAVGECRGVGLDRKNRSHSRVFLHHTLAVADVMMAFEIACRERPDVDFIRADEILARAPVATGGLRRPFRWQVDVRVNGRQHGLGIEPDKVFGLRFNTAQGKSHEVFFFLEADRGTMPIVRKDLEQSSFRRKVLAYDATWSQHLHRRRFGIPDFRVLTVTPSVQRLEHLIDACKSVGTAPGLFLFRSTEEDWSDALEAKWFNLRGAALTL